MGNTDKVLLLPGFAFWCVFAYSVRLICLLVRLRLLYDLHAVVLLIGASSLALLSFCDRPVTDDDLMQSKEVSSLCVAAGPA